MAKNKKSDNDTVSKELHELDHLQNRYGIGREKGREIIDLVGHSRKRIMKYARENNLIQDKKAPASLPSEPDSAL